MDDEAAHRFTRERGVNRPLYELVRIILLPLVKVWYRFRVTGAEHIPVDGPVIVAPNHKSFYDSFFLGRRRQTAQGQHPPRRAHGGWLRPGSQLHLDGDRGRPAA